MWVKYEPITHSGSIYRMCVSLRQLCVVIASPNRTASEVDPRVGGDSKLKGAGDWHDNK